MKAADILRLSGVAAALGGALRVAAAFIPSNPDTPALELLRYDFAGNLDAEQVEIRERPPITTIAAYRELRSASSS